MPVGRVAYCGKEHYPVEQSMYCISHITYTDSEFS